MPKAVRKKMRRAYSGGRSSLEELHRRLRERGIDFEILVAENGSSDRTVPIAEELCEQSAQTLMKGAERLARDTHAQLTSEIIGTNRSCQFP